jgi:transposase
MTVDIDQLSQILSKIDILRFKSIEFNMIYYLFTATKRSIRIFLKLREDIIKESTFSTTKYNPISTHNAAKYVEKYHYLDKITLSRKKKQWQELINIAGFEYDDEFVQIVFNDRDE